MTTRPGAAQRWARWLTAWSVLALSATACSTPTTTNQPISAASGAASGAAASQSQAAELQAGLTYLLVERTYLTATVTRAVIAANGRRDTPSVKGQRQSLDATSIALANLLGASYLSARDPFLSALRSYDRVTVEGAVARAAGEPAALTRAMRASEVSVRELATLVHRVVPGLHAEDLTARFRADLQAQLAVDDNDPYGLLRRAAGRAPGTARLLAKGIAADRGLGPAGTAAATLRADLTAVMTEHPMLLDALAREVLLPRGDRASALAALHANTAALAGLLSTAYPALQSPVQELLDRRDAGLVSYVQARATGTGQAQRGAVLAEPTEFGALLGSYVTGLPANALARESAVALDQLVAAIEATLAGAPDNAMLLRQATAAVPVVAALLAAAIAEDQQLR